MKKKPPSKRHKLQILLSFSAFTCILTLLRIASRAPSPTAPIFEQQQQQQFFNGVPKIAFLFLARSNLPLDFLWDSFFKDVEGEKFMIYIHTRPGFVFDNLTTSSAFFYDRQITNPVKVVWGESTMIEAERLLLREALEDPANQRFVLISDSCVPLYNFSYIYSYLMSSPKSFVDSFLDKKEARYSAKMSPIISEDSWRKGSQWIALVRKHAEIVVADNSAFLAFRRFCKRLTVPVFGGRLAIKIAAWKDHARKEHDCIPDEHYVQTLLSMKHLEDELERRTLTYTLWNQSTDAEDKNGWHPMTFELHDVSRKRIAEIKNIGHVHYETEYRTEWCQCNAKLVPCFLFARKFSRDAAMQMIADGLIGRVDSQLENI